MCCICYKSCQCEYGHNPFPIIDTTDSINEHLRCCNKCNKTIVVPNRLKQIVSYFSELDKIGGKHRIYVDGTRDMNKE